jgi:hypothetical protein
MCALIVVEDIMRARKLYEDLLHQKVISDFGDCNLTFEGGLAFYKRGLYQELIGDLPILNRSNNFELYFEIDRLEQIENTILEGGFEFIHRIKEEPWRQNVFRFYDRDNNIVVVAEHMDYTIRRLFTENYPVDEIVKLTGMPKDEIEQALSRVL